MSYLNTPIPDVRPVRTVRISDKAEFPDGTTSIIFGVGSVDKNTSGKPYWDNTAKGIDTEAIPKNECGLWVDEIQRPGAQNSGAFINWLYTGSQEFDPVHILGLDEPSLERIQLRNKAIRFVVKQPQMYYFVPILKVAKIQNGRSVSYDIDNGEMLHLVLSSSQFDKLLSEAKRFADETNADMAGRVINVEIDRTNKNKSDIYKFNATTRIFTAEEYPDLHARFNAERLEIVRKIEAQIADVHKGVWGNPDESAKAVWATMLEKTGLTAEAFITKYYSGPESKLIDATGTDGLNVSDFSIDDDE